MTEVDTYVREQAPHRSRLMVALGAATAFAALTALGARVQFHLPFTPVPVTGQVFCVLLAGGVLGARLGFVSQVQYLAAGAAGLPVFAGGGGMPCLLGPTGGYLLAFPVAAFAVGALCQILGDRGLRALAAALSGVVVIHVLGACWYAVWITAVGGRTDLMAVLSQAVLPFIALDVGKAAMAAAVFGTAWRRLPFV
jgi:biotin transport system substrate-specific component